jgi:hypothetical protein
LNLRATISALQHRRLSALSFALCLSFVAECAVRCRPIPLQFVVTALVEDAQTILKRSLLSGPPAPWLRIVYNCRDDTELEGSTLIGTGPDVYKKQVGGLLILIALLATVSYLTGCGGAGSGSSSQPSEEQESRGAGSTEQKSGGVGSSGQASAGRLGHPALGEADAPVVLTEYSDYQ